MKFTVRFIVWFTLQAAVHGPNAQLKAEADESAYFTLVTYTGKRPAEQTEFGGCVPFLVRSKS